MTLFHVGYFDGVRNPARRGRQFRSFISARLALPAMPSEPERLFALQWDSYLSERHNLRATKCLSLGRKMRLFTYPGLGTNPPTSTSAFMG